MRQYGNEYYEFVERNLSALLHEMSAQPAASSLQDGFEARISRVREWIEDHAEYGIAYEEMVVELETGDFRLSGRAAIKLLEIALLFGFKTERLEDKRFNIRAETKR